jgi:hypothetical protein
MFGAWKLLLPARDNATSRRAAVLRPSPRRTERLTPKQRGRENVSCATAAKIAAMVG